MAEPRIGLAEFVSSLRDELKLAASEAIDTLPIEVTSVKIELSVSATQEIQGEAGIKFWVVNLGGGGSAGSESVQRLTIELSPRNPDGTTLKIRDDQLD